MPPSVCRLKAYHKQPSPRILLINGSLRNEHTCPGEISKSLRLLDLAKFVQRGKRRIHQKPTAGEIRHYRWWLDKELALVHPRLIVALGATAVLALAGKSVPIARFRGEADFAGRRGYITVHPSFLLRIPERDAKRRAYAEFVADLRAIRALAGSSLARQASTR